MDNITFICNNGNKRLSSEIQYNNSIETIAVGEVCGYMFCAADIGGNVGCDDVSTFTIQTADTCTYGGSGDWHINCADNCVLETDTYLPDNDIHTYGTGTLTVKALIDARSYYIRCITFCHNAPVCLT